MVQFRAIDKRRTSAEIIAQFQSLDEDIQKGVLTEMANSIAEKSRETEDTGTYAESHEIAIRSGSFQPFLSSRGKPRGGTGGQSSAKGLKSMLGDINRLKSGSHNIVFRNMAVHASAVERKGWGTKPPYRIYSRVQREGSDIIKRVVQQFTSRPS